ncbi:ATP-binding protein [Neptunitalea lumnitzerae]|uniref:histidine kinase n=1 Tax=Neptunitalea lumnitzerae TaxID=2965509 RepID=A0ABQ5MJS8_9FLAO|nr:ATP-binding protein [Neptunitalea sp. Y10]GLB49663.1 histidine kinase [Neptunitalea sp. Y10]
MATPSNLYPQKVDLTNCDKEPIHKLNRVQLFGFILVVDIKNFTISQYSTNISDFISFDKTYLNEDVSAIIGEKLSNLIMEGLNNNDLGPYEYVSEKGEHFLINPNVSNEHLILEFEPIKESIDAIAQQQQLTQIITKLDNAKDEMEMCDMTAQMVKDFLGYDRVMIYQFDENWNGQVVSEAREPHLESWLGLHYPATDIPQQARKLFMSQGVRLISEVTREAATFEPELSPLSNDILDMSKSELRAPSLIHVEYLENMKVKGTLTAAIVYNNTLWGLIACHHYSPKILSYHKRLSVKFLTQVFSTQLGLRSFNSSLKKVNESSIIRSKLVKQMSINWNIVEGLSGYDTNLIGLTEAKGAAIIMDGETTLIGQTPSVIQIENLKQWLLSEISENDIFYTNKLSSMYAEGFEYKEVASGVLALLLNKGTNALFWFKPEQLQVVDWGGNPNKPAEIGSEARLSPRKSFEKWSENVEGESLPWLDYEISAAKALKDSISEIIIQKYDEVMRLNQKLEKAYKELESFSYSVSHDLRAPLRGIDGFAQIIKEDYYDSLDDFGKSALETIITSTEKMNVLIDDILNFSGLHQKELRAGEIDVNLMINEIMKLNRVATFYPDTKIIIQDNLPSIYGDRSMIAQLFSNLINNALKYSSEKQHPVIEIGSHNNQAPVVYYITDNGIGIDMKFKDAIFGVFNRLVDESYAGSGIGLAIVKRVVEKHKGNIWVDSEIGVGTTFNFCLNINDSVINE